MRKIQIYAAVSLILFPWEETIMIKTNEGKWFQIAVHRKQFSQIGNQELGFARNNTSIASRVSRKAEAKIKRDNMNFILDISAYHDE